MTGGSPPRILFALLALGYALLGAYATAQDEPEPGPATIPSCAGDNPLVTKIDPEARACA